LDSARERDSGSFEAVCASKVRVRFDCLRLYRLRHAHVDRYV